jgi:hypothetical protein
MLSTTGDFWQLPAILANSGDLGVGLFIIGPSGRA